MSAQGFTNQHGRLKGIFGSRSKFSSESQLDRSTSQGNRRDDASGTGDFLPNPEISSSPGSLSPRKKVWEGAYNKFLTRGKNKSPSTSTTGEQSPGSHSSENSQSIISEGMKKKNSAFSLLPGSKRLVTRATSVPSSAIDFPEIRPPSPDQDIHAMPTLPSMSSIKDDSSVGMRSRSASSENAVRGGSHFKQVFMRRGGPPRNASTGDDLDAPLRNGIQKTTSSPDYRKMFVDTHEIGQTISEGDGDDNVGLDYLLEAASTSASDFYVSHSSNSLTRLALQPMPRPPSFLQPEKSQYGMDQSVDNASLPALLPSYRQRQVAPITYEAQIPAGSSLLSQQMQHIPQHLAEVEKSQTDQQSSSSPNTLVSYLSDPSFVVGSSPTSAAAYQYHNTVDEETRKLFTMYHNDSRYNRDSTEPFLGGDTASSLRDYPRSSQHLVAAYSGAIPATHTRRSSDMQSPLRNLASSAPLEPVDENSILIQNLRLLRPVQGVDSWQSGRRYLIAAAAMASCQLSVIDRLSGSIVRSAFEASTSPSRFGTVDLGEALMTYIGDKHHLSLGKWSSCRLVLRQNYLLEFDVKAPVNGTPRGFAHLQHAAAYPSQHFSDSLELHFYVSPCAKADPRVLLIRTSKRDERDHWVACLNKAAQMRLEDLWELETEEFGRGRYASVCPAIRKDDEYHTKKENGETDDSAFLKRCSCALKIIDKNEFWRRVVKGRERADTLVRELSVQSTLTAKCGSISTFLKIRGFFETSDMVVLELELLEGSDLFDHISQENSLTEEEAAFITQDILVSLEAMNRVGLAHRDVKPANILMCNRDKDKVSVKVGDFGMSTFVGVDGLVRGRCGTPGYVAPEILTAGSGAGYGNQVDVFSAGVTLYVMLCGYEPFYGENEKALIEANKKAIVDFPDNDWSEVSEEARDLICQMLKPDPKERITAKQALVHPWMTSYTKASNSDQLGSKSIHIPASDVPETGACIVS